MEQQLTALCIGWFSSHLMLVCIIGIIYSAAPAAGMPCKDFENLSIFDKAKKFACLFFYYPSFLSVLLLYCCCDFSEFNAVKFTLLSEL